MSTKKDVTEALGLNPSSLSALEFFKRTIQQMVGADTDTIEVDIGMQGHKATFQVTLLTFDDQPVVEKE